MALEVNANVGLTDSLDFTPKNPAVASRSVRTLVQPTNSGNQAPGTIVRFVIPTGSANQYLDPSQSFLMYTLNNNDATAATSLAVDSTGYSVINRMDTYASSGQLESIINYNVLMTALIDLQYDTSTSMTSGSINLGMASPGSNNVDRTGISIATGSSADFCLPLQLNSIIGGGNKKYLPLSKIPNLELQLTLESVAQAVVSASATASFYLSNMTLVLTMVNLDPNMSRMIEHHNGGKYLISTQQWKNFNFATSGSRTQDNILVTGKFSSLCSTLTTVRDQAHVGVLADHGVSSRSNPCYSATNARCGIQWVVGSQYIPAQPIRGPVGEVWQSTQEMLHQLSDVDNASRCTLASFSQANYDAGASTSGTWCYGQSFTSFVGKTSTMTSGLATVFVPMVLNMTYPSTNNTAQIVDVFTCFDSIIEISDAGMAVRY